ncbi:MAG: 3-oxoacyl-[acyl-carrier-protein] synthase III C-terminal domain-containing protein [Syntrophales bacterium]|nr:3-oxoacyl-[acyl-carrier-protein] synthase III C-terminal domain-containing protein [Syntrophales bacterium]
MVGITSYGAYIPRYRIDRGIVYKAMGWLNPGTFMAGEKAVANFDEDSITMAAAAGIDCLQGMDRLKMDALYFATTTSPYKERQSAEIIATVFNLRSDIRTADITDSIKSGTTSLLAALDALKAGSAKNAIVCAADCRVAKPGSSQEELFGDGAAALAVGDSGVIADFIDSYSVSYDFVDHWRGDGHIFDRQWEDRFIRDTGYSNFILEAISGLAKKCKLDVKSIAKVVYPCLYEADHKGIGKKLGLNPEQIQDHMISNVGYTGTASPLMMLVAALEDAKPGDNIVVASFGNGSDALLFKVTDEIEKIKGKRRGTKKYLAAKRELKNYEKFVSFRNVLPVDKGIRGEIMPATALSALWRDRKEILGLCGSKCTACGTPQFPVQRICVNPDCNKTDQMEDYIFSDKGGILFTYTGDLLAFTPNPPAIYGFVDFNGGGRFWFDITDADLEAVKVDMPVEMSFRRKYYDQSNGIHGYFWKAVPAL